MNLRLTYLIDNLKELLIKLRVYKPFEEIVNSTLDGLKQAKFYDEKYSCLKI